VLDVSLIFATDSPLIPAGRTAISGRISTLFRYTEKFNRFPIPSLFQCLKAFDA